MAKKLKEWFDRDCAIRLGESIRQNYQNFDVAHFAKETDRHVGALELKDRVLQMAKLLKEQLPENYTTTAKILEQSLGPALKGETGMFNEGYWLMPVARFVEEFGLEHFDVSMKLCAEITQRNTAEYAVRPYIETEPEKALSYFQRWTRSDSAHVRRLASEGVRPRLPWAKQLPRFIEDPTPILELIAPLKSDPSAYVRKSVANLINDVSRDHPDQIVLMLEEWKKLENPHTDWIIRHGSRTLRKNEASF